MEFSQILMDSVSRCFGAPVDDISPVITVTKFADRPLGASREAKQNISSMDLYDNENNNQNNSGCLNDIDSHLQNPNFKSNGRPICGIENFMAESSTTPQQQRRNSNNEQHHPNDCIPTSDKLNKSNNSYTTPNTKKPESFTPISNESRKLAHQASIERSQTKCGKRRLDIFRSPQNSNNSSSSSSSQTHQRSSSSTTSFASRLLGSPPFPSGAMLCFANPILDEEDEEIELQRADEITVGDEETVTSTLYFDAKYAHVVETHPPMALYPSCRVGRDADLLDIFQSGSHKTITSIFCRKKGSRGRADHPPPPPSKRGSRMQSMADETMDYNDDEYDEEGGEKKVETVFEFVGMREEEEKYMEDENGRKVRRKSRNSPNACQLNDLDVISAVARSKDRGETVDMRSMKLMSNSSQSTAALTPVCSSRSHASMSPVLEGQGQLATLH